MRQSPRAVDMSGIWAPSALNVGLRRADWVVEALRSTSVSLAFAARGIFDGHLQKITTMWDIAGGAVLAREAGLQVRIGTRDGSGTPWIAAGTASLMAVTESLWPKIRPGKDDAVAATAAE
ncbi:hypothetical protein PYH37_003826 [Sinorhizobium numidicum]|uniref:Uncharacterized protein n=1 Tax=Sinorhizobium numidicum TaxID=680248 RepID=A0ABY8CY51_9HYPH|nr:inositol monophosphatase family protein [Sinorhizobium numidicum]WEX78887.1 hypothetical protein PYH37_003826 [Sinorhizobium numidicum]WEX82283.1 hypothetical protein PYH38_004538 [Sinorhizobium numidicum]